MSAKSGTCASFASTIGSGGSGVGVSATTSSKWNEEDETCWDRRSRLEKKLSLALGLAIVLICGFAFLFAVRPRSVQDSSFSSNGETCSTPACLQAASQIIAHVDTRVDPCDDFFKFSCNRFIEHTHGDLKVTSVKELKDLVERQVEEILDEPVAEDDPAPLKRQKLLLRACLNESMEEESTYIFEEHLDQLGGWPVALGYRWYDNNFDWIETVVRLRQMGYEFEMLFGFQLEKDLQDSGRHILKIRLPYIEKVEKDVENIYKQLMADVARAFGADKSRAALDMEKVFDFREKLAQISDRIFEKNAQENDKTKYKIGEFQKLEGMIDWLGFINAVLYPVANLTLEDYAIFPPPEIVKDYLTLINKVRKRILANYIFWEVIKSTAPYFRKDVRNLIGNYSCQTSGETFKQDRLKLCHILIRESFFANPVDLEYARRYLPEEKRNKVTEILKNVKDEFLNIFERNTWMDEESKDKLIDKVKDMKEVVGAPGDYFNESTFDIFKDEELEDSSKDKNEDYYENDVLEDNGDNVEKKEVEEAVQLFPTILRNFKQQIDNSFLLLRAENSSLDEYVFLLLATTVNALYLLRENAIMIPAGILQGIFYDEYRPMYLNYGSIGSIIGHELTHSVCKDASRYNKDGNADELWSEETAESFDEVTQCMVSSAENFDVEGTENIINGTRTLEENVADYTGVKVAYAAYDKWVQENGEELPLPGLDYTPRQLFWIAAILHDCYALRGEKLERELERDIHANNAFRAISPMRNNRDFATDFACEPGSNMNPVEKCQIF